MNAPVSVPAPGVESHGVPYMAGQAIEGVLQAALAQGGVLDGCVLRMQPVTASALEDGELIVGVEDASDDLRPAQGGVQPGQQPQRVFTFALWVIARTPDARLRAHAVYVACAQALRLNLKAFTDAGITVNGQGLLEGRKSFRLQDVDVGGALVLSSWSLDYQNRLRF